MLPNQYLNGGYYDNNGHLRREIIVEHAQLIAKKLDEKGMSSASLRRFYSRVLGIKKKIDISGDFDAARPLIDMLIRDVSYTVKRNIVPPVFEKFISENVKYARQSNNDFNGFFQHYQSVIAFSKSSDDRGSTRGGQTQYNRSDGSKYNNRSRRKY